MPTKVNAWQSQRSGKVFDNAKDAAKDENKLDRAKLKVLKERIKSGKKWTPKVGDYIYVQTHLYIDHGEDDVVGGLAQVTKVYKSMSGGDPNTVFVQTAQHPGGGSNWSQHLVNEQAKEMKRYGDEFAYEDPDVVENPYA